MTQGKCLWFWCVGLLLVLMLAGCNKPEPGHVEDEARRAGRTAASFPAADEDYYHDMDGGIALTADEIKGRNMWLVWTGGERSPVGRDDGEERGHVRFAEDDLVRSRD